MIKILFILILLYNTLKIISAINGVIWSQSHQKFVPLFSIPTFLDANNERLSYLRNIEFHNFQKEALKIAYFEETNLVSFIDNDTKISGVCGELWNILADYLNFTLIPVKTENRNFGLRTANGSYDGILGLIESNQSQIVPRAGVFQSRLSLLDYTLPLWIIRYHLYIKPEWRHDEAWMLHLFKAKLWYAFLCLLFILSVAGYLCERYSIKHNKDNTHFNLQDHIFYTIAIASSQGCVPSELPNKSRIIYLCTSLFSWLILIAFSSHAIILMMNKKFILPFTDLKSLIQESKYDVVAFSGSMVHQQFEETVRRYYKYSRDFKRVSYEPGAEELYKKVCFSEKKKIAAFEAEDRHKAIGKNICRLVPSRASYFETWIASAVKRGFRYKRSFDVGILKMSEAGLIDGLRDRWLDWKLEESEEIPFQSIDMSQVYLTFGILFLGFTTSIFILLIEKLTYSSNENLRNRIQQNKVKVLIKAKTIKSAQLNRMYYNYKYNYK